MFLRKCGDFSFVWSMFIWVCLSGAGETEGVVLLCCQIKCVSAAGWNDVHMCMSVCRMRKYNRHVRAVNAQQTDILRSQYTAFCEGYLENTGRVQMKLISIGRSYQTRLGTKCERMIVFYLLVKYGHHIRGLEPFTINKAAFIWS